LHEQAGVRLRVISAQDIVEDSLRAVALFAVFAIASITVLLSAIMVLNVHPLAAFPILYFCYQ
jgi:hypothetical protein